VKIQIGGSLNDNHVPEIVLCATPPNSYGRLCRCSRNAVPDSICPQSRTLPLVYCPQIKLSTLYVAMTTVRIQFVGSSYASRLPARRGKEINDKRGRSSRETVRVEDETACRCKKSRKQAENVLRYLSYRSLLTVLATKPKACISRSHTAWRITDQLSDCGLIHDNHYLVAYN